MSDKGVIYMDESIWGVSVMTLDDCKMVGVLSYTVIAHSREEASGMVRDYVEDLDVKSILNISASEVDTSDLEGLMERNGWKKE